MRSRLIAHKLTLVIALAIALRLILMVVLAPSLDFTREGNAVHGSEGYDEYALNLLETGVYGRTADEPDAMLPPFYSYLLAGVYGIFGRSYIAVALFHTLLDVISIVLLDQIARRIFRGERGAWIGALAGLFFAAYPYLIFQTLTVIDTPIWITLFHAYALLMILLRDHAKWDWRMGVWIGLAGLVLAAAVYTRPIIPFFAVLAALWFLFRLSLWQTLLRLAPVALIGVGLVLPYVVRNYAIYDDFVTMTITSGGNLWQGNNEWTVPVFEAGYDVQWTPNDAVPIDGLSDHDADKLFAETAVTYWRENPDKLPQLFATKFRVHWDPRITPLYNPQFGEDWQLVDGELVIVNSDSDLIGVTSANAEYSSGGLLDTVGRPVHMLYFGGLLLLAIFGMLLSLRLWRDVSLLWFAQISMTITYMLFHPSTRYRSPSDPLLFVLSAYALVVIGSWLLARRKR